MKQSLGAWLLATLALLSGAAYADGAPFILKEVPATAVSGKQATHLRTTQTRSDVANAKAVQVDVNALNSRVITVKIGSSTYRLTGTLKMTPAGTLMWTGDGTGDGMANISRFATGSISGTLQIHGITYHLASVAGGQYASLHQSTRSEFETRSEATKKWVKDREATRLAANAKVRAASLAKINPSASAPNSGGKKQ